MSGQTSLVKPMVHEFNGVSMVLSQAKKLRTLAATSGLGSAGRSMIFKKAKHVLAGHGNKVSQEKFLRSSPSVHRRALVFCAKSSSPPEPQVPNFQIGIKHGALLAISGFIYHSLTGSILGIRFGLVPGGFLLVSSLQDLKKWKMGDSALNAVMTTSAIVCVLYLREAWLVLKKPSSNGYLAAFLSGLVIMLYILRFAHSAWKGKKE